MSRDRAVSALQLFFSGLAEHTFESQLGVADPSLIDYIATLLTRFVHSDELYAVRTPNGRRLTDVHEMILEAEARLGDARREVHRHVGDFTLFWTGFYPEALRRLERGGKRDWYGEYRQLGKRAYFIASTIRTELNSEESDVLERLSHDFELCQYGLGELRRQWERTDPPGGTSGPLLFN